MSTKAKIAQNVVTIGIRQALDESLEVGEWAVKALDRISRDGGIPDFIVGRQDVTTEKVEDNGRTLVLPLAYPKKCYCVINETGGATLMLADEY